MPKLQSQEAKQAYLRLSNEKRIAYDARLRWLQAARPKQIPPRHLDWFAFLALAGRGFGKTFLCAQDSWWYAAWNDGVRIAVVAPTNADLRRTVFEGESGLLAVTPPELVPDMPGEKAYNKGTYELKFWNGSIIQGFSSESYERLRGPQFHRGWCVPAETLVTMGDGTEKPIIDVKVDDHVMTRKGPRRVTASALTRRHAEVFRLEASNGRYLEATADHEIFVNSSYQALSNITPSSKLTTWERSESCRPLSPLSTHPLLWNGTANDTTLKLKTFTTDAQAEVSCTEICGSTLMDPFPLDTKFTTETKLSSITSSKTLSFRNEGNTDQGITSENLAAVPLADTLKQRKICGANEKLNSGPASFAERLTNPFLPIVPIAETHAGLKHDTTVQQVSTTFRVTDVYDITVDEEHEFFANGILVHNCEELAAWPYLQETWDQLMMTLRLIPPNGGNPQVIISTTPKPFALIKQLSKREDIYKVSGSTYENKNLAKSFLDVIKKQYEGTRMGMQELEGKILEDTPGALWNWKMIERARYMGICPEFSMITVNIDPSVGDGKEKNDECGITGTALGQDGFGYLLADKTDHYSPDEWATVAVNLAEELGAHQIIAEANNGGKLVESVLNAGGCNIPIRLVHAAQGKRTRAEPVSRLYEQGRIRHFGVFSDLETQLTEWSPTISEYSPGRLDALVWGFTGLMVEKPSEFFADVA